MLDLTTIQTLVLTLVNDDSEDVTLDKLTQVTLEGSGVFDTLMRAASEHLKKEHDAQRITGDQYALTYTTIITEVLQQSIAFLLGKGQYKLQRATTLLELAKLDQEIALYLQRLVTEKANVMDSTILDPTATVATSPQDGNGNSFSNTIQPIQGTIGRKNATLERQQSAYDDDYKTKVGSQILDAHKVLLSNIIDIGTLPTELANASIDQLIEHLKLDSKIVNDATSDTQREDGSVDSDTVQYTNDQYQE